MIKKLNVQFHKRTITEGGGVKYVPKGGFTFITILKSGDSAISAAFKRATTEQQNCERILIKEV